MIRCRAKIQLSMETSVPNRSTPRNAQLPLALFFVLGAIPSLSAQTFVNGDFEDGSTGWTGCNVEIISGSLLGIPGSGHLAMVDGHLDPGPSDDRSLCQNISDLIIGNVYRIDLDATRFANSSTPDPLTATLTIDDVLTRTITRTGGYAMVHEQFYFTASRSTHAFSVVIDQQCSAGMLFDDIAVTAVSVMSIQLTAFNAEASDNGVQLYWTTASERNNAYFTLQRSLDGVVFTDVLRTDAVGNSQVPVTYVAVDHAPIDGLSYYRLMQTDMQGVSTTFTVVPMLFRRQFDQPLSVYPNPSAGRAAWLYARDVKEDTVAPLSITDQQGNVVYKEVIAIHPGTPVDLAALVDLLPGTYAVSLSLTSGQESVRLLVL